jgi:predicted nucleotidyltransferase
MGIPEDQLNRWSQQGAQTTAKATHESIRTALSADSSSIKGKEYEIFLQGSYKNDTNIRGDSDVDVVVKLTSTFSSNKDELPAEEQQLHKEAYRDATYSWTDFRRDVLESLRKYYGSLVTEGNKSIKIAARPGTLNADVVVSCQYRKYRRFRSSTDNSYADGIIFWTRPDNNCIISYPKPHYDNVVEKNRLTNMQFKPSVRMFKNARTHLVDKGVISDALAPSYFIECMIFNVPNSKFDTSFRNTYCNVAKWLNEVEIKELYCPNNEIKLFGTDSRQWSVDSAKSFISHLIRLWNNW